MPLTVSVGLSQKAGLPNYGSKGASCGLQFELDASLLRSDLELLQLEVNQAYVACREAVKRELDREQEVTVNGNGASPSESAVSPAKRAGQTATERQIDYARQLAAQIPAFSVRPLESISQQMFGKPVASLTTLDASGLIDALKDFKSGQLDVTDFVNGVPS